MRLDLEIYGDLCATSVFVINGIRADHQDFGDQYDADPDNAEECGCGDMKFFRKPATPGVLAKYGISIPEYELVAGQLETGLSFGACGWCV